MEVVAVAVLGIAGDPPPPAGDDGNGEASGGRRRRRRVAEVPGADFGVCSGALDDAWW